MKANRTFILIFLGLLAVYIVAQLNQPRKFDWVPSLRNNDKNPFGTYIPFTELKQLFSHASIQTNKIPIYNVLHGRRETNSAYILLEPKFEPGKTDLPALLDYVKEGNSVFLSSFYIDKELLDTLGLKLQLFNGLIPQDSTSINFVNPSLRAKDNYSFKKSMIDGYFEEVTKKDSTAILGIRQDSMPNFVRVRFGKGSFFIHSAPLCFTNYFILYENNRDYVAKALSYLSPSTGTIHWDEYYKSGREGADTPLRFILSNLFLAWALWLTVIAFVVFILFEMKRRQRIIPVIEPLRNTTLDFIETVSSVYYGQHDNSSIAHKKIQFWLEHIRQRYYLSTTATNEEFAAQLHRKSGVSRELIDRILQSIDDVQANPTVSDGTLTALTSAIDEFNQLSKT